MCVGRRCFSWLSSRAARPVLAVLVVPVDALTAGAGPRTIGLRRRLVVGRTCRKVPVGPGEAGPAAAGGDDRFSGLRRQNGRQKAGLDRQDAGQAGGTAEVPVRLDAGQKKNYSRPAWRYGLRRRRRLAVRRRIGGLWWRLGRRRRRNRCAGMRRHHVDHGGCVCASVACSQRPEH